MALLAGECGRPSIQLVVACHELPIVDAAVSSPAPSRAEALPVAVCYLLHESRRMQIADSTSVSRVDRRAATEVVVEPPDLPRERVRLYRRFAADWCRVLEVSPRDFARLRAVELTRRAHTAGFEDLMGHVLPANFEPRLDE